MAKIPLKTLEDLEYREVLRQCALHAITPLGKENINNLIPGNDKVVLMDMLQATSEFRASFDNENRIPNHGFEDCSAAISLLRIENSILDIETFRNIASNTDSSNTLLKFLIKFKSYYPTLFNYSTSIYEEKEIKAAVDNVIDRFGEVRDRASEELYRIRKEINFLRSKIGTSFNKALRLYAQADYLDDIRESVQENRRVLAVKAMYRRKVKGAVLGSSKTGSIVFIEPESTHALSRELNNLKFEETEEINKILQNLTDFIRPFSAYLKTQHEFLLKMDCVYAKACYAREINGILPEINTEKIILDYKDAFHPLLYSTHQRENKPTFPQDITLHHEQRIVVISGPNAGGKSITLKTIGLLQLMLQSGLLIPVHERSKACFFDRILTDIGDNQSIENHLSTYSYRLNNMKYFLKKCSASTLFLIDEFGTGSDPELGGALAEAILEDFYDRNAYGLITTHYANLKALADEKRCMINANMQFDNKTLEPVFKLVMGEAGSSFTFEVAQKNGLPYSLINRAKKKIEKGKVRFDATIAKLQKERTSLQKTEQSLKSQEQKAAKESEELETINAKLKAKLYSYQELYDHHQRMIQLGDKVNRIAERFFETNKKRPLIASILQLIETENSKRKRKSGTIAKKERDVKKKQEVELQKTLNQVRKEKKKEKRIEKHELSLISKIELRVGDRVRLEDGRSIGTIESFKKNLAIVNYGQFTTQVNIEQLIFVASEKKKR